jgi:hypothetical protein
MARSLFLALLLGCAHQQPKPAPIDVSKLPPLPRSSIAAVLEHRGELGLSDEQVRKMGEIDAQRAKAQEELNEKGSEQHAQRQPSNARAGGGGMGMRGMGMGRRGGMGGMGGYPRRGSGDDSQRAPVTLQDRLDEIDTKAYLEVEEEVLGDLQRPHAREIAEDYREKVYERRELLRRAAQDQSK